ncbi:hypothetical protein VNI00_015724 [Paramarasmius palmivorus]|uniref:CxC2-like cysteine cluster KDZ transposase-associated domain-containing protein n=1 Tax=Paramarasmius palmivorus TaxID=297713 RepID=A0AAW0BIL7_9AGAR
MKRSRPLDTSNHPAFKTRKLTGGTQSISQTVKSDGSIVKRIINSPRKSRVALLPSMAQEQSASTSLGGPLFPSDLPSMSLPLEIDNIEPMNVQEKLEEEESPAKKKPDSQATQRLKEFMEHVPLLSAWLLAQEYNSGINSPCACGRGLRTTQCQDCHNYDLACSACFIDSHRTSPLHWARVWWNEGGFFRRHDISTLQQGVSIHLRHLGGLCRNPTEPRSFVITCSNGVHATLVSFCRCFQSAGKSHVQQLMESGLFPGSIKEPKSAFSFALLKQYDLHSLQAKSSDYDYYMALRRLTDDVFTSEVNDQYQAFMIVTRIWRYMTTRIRVGQENGIDDYFPHRPSGTVMLYCPACPDPGVNMKGSWWLTPAFLRHLIQRRKTVDGNSQINQFWKNFDGSDFSVHAGLAHFPDATAYLEYLESLGGAKAEEYSANCQHVKVIANQNRIRNQNCRKSGGVNVQCDHVLVEATTDMMHGEQFGVVDAAIAHALRQTSFTDSRTTDHAKEVDHEISYDSNCQYCVNRDRRFDRAYLNGVKEVVSAMGCIVPDVHIKGHQDDCTVLFSHNYRWCLGHFHGETAEYYWPELNQVGSFTRQMNDGHRADTIIAHHNDWNWKKIINMAELLADALTHARSQYILRRDHLQQLSMANRNRAPGWSRLNREPELVIVGKTKVWASVYHRRPGKVPTVKALLQQISKASDVPFRVDLDLNPLESYFLYGLDAEKEQLHIRELVRASKSANSDSSKDEITSRRRKLADRLEKFWAFRAVLIPQVLSLVQKEQKDWKVGIAIEEEKLFLPSDVPSATRVQLNMTTLGSHEASLREAQLNELVSNIKTVAGSIGTMLEFRSKNIKDQDAKTRSEKEVASAFSRRDRLIIRYNQARQALINLGLLDPKDKNSPYPHMKPADTHRLRVNIRRQAGDSRRSDGMLWRLGAASEFLVGDRLDESLPIGLGEAYAPQKYGSMTQVTQRVSAPTGPRPKKRIGEAKSSDEGSIPEASDVPSDNGVSGNISGSKKKTEDGWIWKKGARTTLNEQEMKEWEDEGDRIQWMRAEAEMYRWMEQFEIKHAEFERTIAHFKKMEEVWISMATRGTTSGHSAHAFHQGVVFRNLAAQALARYQSVCHPSFAHRDRGTMLADKVLEWRNEQLRWMDDMSIHRAYLDAKKTVRHLNPQHLSRV